VKIVKNERDPPLFTSKQLIKFSDSKKHNSSYRTTGFVYRRTDGHGETSIPLYNFVAGGIIMVEKQ
jgi:hypothetical protein